MRTESGGSMNLDAKFSTLFLTSHSFLLSLSAKCQFTRITHIHTIVRPKATRLSFISNRGFAILLYRVRLEEEIRRGGEFVYLWIIYMLS